MEDRKKDPRRGDAPHRRGLLRGVAAGAASGLGLQAGLAQAKPPAERGFPAYGLVAYIEDFAPDFHGPDYDWSSAIYRAMESFPGNDKHLPGGTIVFANKHNLEAYKVKSTIVVRRQIHFLGMGLKAVLQFPPHVDGFHFINADKGPDSVYSSLTNLSILGTGSVISPKGPGTGVKASVAITIDNCVITQWWEYCVHFYTDSQGQGPDGWRISNSGIGACAGTGFYVTGHNSNVGTMFNCMVTRCASGRAIHDESFLGNTYVAVMCSYGGIYASGDATNHGNTCTFVGCYVESGNPCYIAEPSVVIGGELSSIGNQDIPLGSALFLDGTNISNGLRYFASEATGAFFDGKHTVEDPPKRRRTASITFGGPGARDAHSLMGFREEADNTGWGFRWVRLGHFGWNYAGASIGYYGLNFYTKNAQPANGFSRDLSNGGLGGIGFDLGFFLGPGQQKFTGSDALPRRGSHAAGDICFNYSFKPGGVSHWRCVASGTPGDWEPVFELSGKAYTVATLPKAAPGLQGARAHVTDAKAPSFLAPLVGGGSTVCPAFCNGAEWVAG